jgi:hypothetical protein
MNAGPLGAAAGKEFVNGLNKMLAGLDEGE